MMNLIPFNVEPQKLPDNWFLQYLSRDEWDAYVLNKIWKVVGLVIRGGKNPFTFIIRNTGADDKNEWLELTQGTNIYFSNLLYLVREGAWPVWYPEKYCKVIEITKGED